MSKRGASRNHEAKEQQGVPDLHEQTNLPRVHGPRTQATREQLRAMDVVRAAVNIRQSRDKNIQSVAQATCDEFPLMNSVMMAESIKILHDLAVPPTGGRHRLSLESLRAVACVAELFSSDRILKDAGIREVVNSLHLLAQIRESNLNLDLYSGDSIRKMVQALKHHLPNMNDLDIGLFASAAVALKLDTVKYVSAIEIEALSRIQGMSGETLSDIANLHDVIGSPDAFLAPAIARAFEVGVGSWEIRENARIAFSLSSIYANFSAKERFDSLTDKEKAILAPFLSEWPAIAQRVFPIIAARIEEMNSGVLAMFTKAIRLSADKGIRVDGNIKAIEDRATAIGRSLHPVPLHEMSFLPTAVRHLISVSASLSRMGERELTCLGPVLLLFRNHPRCLDGRGAARIAEILSLDSERHPEIFEDLAAVMIQDIETLEHKQVIQVMSAYDRRNVNVPKLFHALGQRFASQIEIVSNFELSRFTHSIAAMGAMSETGNNLINAELERRERAGKITSLENVAGAVYGLALDMNSDFRRTWNLVERIAGFSDLSDDAISLIYRAGFGRDQTIPDELKARFEARKPLVVTGAKSRLEASVIDPLLVLAEQHNCEVVREHRIIDYSVDFGILGPTRKIALEVDGTSFHRIGGREGNPRRPNDVLRDMTLNRAGYRVVRISDYQWGEIPLERQMDYLEVLLFPKS